MMCFSSVLQEPIDTYNYFLVTILCNLSELEHIAVISEYFHCQAFCQSNF